MHGWTHRDSLELYNLEAWGAGFFTVNDRGHVEVRPQGPSNGGIDLLELVRDLGIRHHIGVRARLTARGAGKWVDSTGDRSKFGLSAIEIVEAVDRLRSEDMLDCLELLHFHIGSQITAIRAHKEALSEASR